MGSVESIEDAVQVLSRTALTEFGSRFAEFDTVACAGAPRYASKPPKSPQPQTVSPSAAKPRPPLSALGTVSETAIPSSR